MNSAWLFDIAVSASRCILDRSPAAASHVARPAPSLVKGTDDLLDSGDQRRLTLVNTRLIAASHLEDRARGLTEEHIQQIVAYFAHRAVAAVAITYFRKFYLRNSFGGVEHDPTLIHVGCLYLASKAEETVLNARYFATTMARKWPGYPYDTRHILDAEMIILKDLDFNLVVFNPYRPLLQLLEDSRAPPDVAQLAWGAMNDCYRCGASGPQGGVAGGEAGQQQGGGGGVGGVAGQVAAVGAKAWAWQEWLGGLKVEWEQVYAVADEVLRLLERPAGLISPEQCSKLLEVARIPLPATA
ncbi:hypothetical protein QJQ45_002353 [Haematococcus lacustris]|nr:hypothetical protein QJQ45_002353 [Haematococcus lacustris]